MNFKPLAGEVANLWQFINSNLAHLCLLEHWLYHAEDEDLKSMLERSKQLANQIAQQGLELYVKAGFPAPIGFDVKKDATPDAPRIMSDKLVLFVLHILSEYGVYGYGLTLGKSETPEVLSYIKECLNHSADLYQSYTELVRRKGYEYQPIFITPAKKAEFVEHQSFLTGWWGEKRPLNALEIDSLTFSLRGVILAKMMFMVFAQISQDPKVKKFCRRGKDLTAKRVESLQSLNSGENLPFLGTYESEITDSTISPFSDRLIMYEAVALAQIAIARYGNAFSTVIRRDLNVMLGGYIVETGTFLDDGLSLMIDKGWFEQPPMSPNRKKLSEG